MNKIKVSKKDMKQNYYIVGIPYCTAQNLLYYENPLAYSSGVYGWSCDYYDVENIVISTGYSYINNKRTAYDYDVLIDYDRQASEIINNYDVDYDERQRQVKLLLNEFITLARYNYEKGE